MKDPAQDFAAFGLRKPLLKALDDLGFEHPTPIQSEAMPVLIGGRDVIGRARTGSGKTAAFGLPLLNRVGDGGPVRGLVLAPTRELAIQVADALAALAEHLSLEILTIYGGASYRHQLRGLKRGATVVVGTPGRVIDLMDRGALDMSGVEYFVLDEADEMLRMGFIDDVERVLAKLPGDRQIALFSATMPKQIVKVAEKYLRNPAEIQVEESALSVDHIEQKFIQVSPRNKDQALLRLLAGTRSGGTLVFARTRAGCAKVAEMLIENGISADALHGDLNQGARERVLGRLRAKALDVVVATDVAARGLDVEHLTHVINYDIPGDAESYVHRIGRTARAGREGTAITLVVPRERRRSRDFERELGTRIQQVNLPTDAEIDATRRDELVDLIKSELVDPGLVEVREWVRKVLAERGWSAEDVASAALHLLGRELNFEFTDEEPEDAPPVYESINEREVAISLGRRDGIRPADIVGTFTNDLGIPADKIGRITLGSRRVFVGLPGRVAKLLLKEHPQIELRGKPARVTPNNSPSGKKSFSGGKSGRSSRSKGKKSGKRRGSSKKNRKKSGKNKKKNRK